MGHAVDTVIGSELAELIKDLKDKELAQNKQLDQPSPVGTYF